MRAVKLQRVPRRSYDSASAPSASFSLPARNHAGRHWQACARVQRQLGASRRQLQDCEPERLQGCVRSALHRALPACAPADPLWRRQVRGAVLLPAGLHVCVPGAPKAPRCVSEVSRKHLRLAVLARRAPSDAPALVRRRRSSPSRTAPRSSRTSTARCVAPPACFLNRHRGSLSAPFTRACLTRAAPAAGWVLHRQRVQPLGVGEHASQQGGPGRHRLPSAG